MSKFNQKNIYSIPKIKKIVINMGLGEDASDGKKIKTCVDDMALIAGQRPVITKLKKSESKAQKFYLKNPYLKKSQNFSKAISQTKKLENLIKNLDILNTKAKSLIKKIKIVMYSNFRKK